MGEGRWHLGDLGPRTGGKADRGGAMTPRSGRETGAGRGQNHRRPWIHCNSRGRQRGHAWSRVESRNDSRVRETWTACLDFYWYGQHRWPPHDAAEWLPFSHHGRRSLQFHLRLSCSRKPSRWMCLPIENRVFCLLLGVLVTQPGPFFSLREVGMFV